MSFPPSSRLAELNVKEVKFYYKNNPIVGNIYTVCVLMSTEQKILARGVSICSLADSHNKSMGRKIAQKRATKALSSKSNNDEIKIYEVEDAKLPGDPLWTYYSSGSLLVFKKSFKTKNEKHLMELVSLIEDSGFNFEIKKFNGIDRVDVVIPYYLPVSETAEEFKFKSEYMPEPTENEKSIFKLGC